MSQNRTLMEDTEFFSIDNSVLLKFTYGDSINYDSSKDNSTIKDLFRKDINESTANEIFLNNSSLSFQETFNSTANLIKLFGPKHVSFNYANILYPKRLDFINNELEMSFVKLQLEIEFPSLYGDSQYYFCIKAFDENGNMRLVFLFLNYYVRSGRATGLKLG